MFFDIDEISDSRSDLPHMAPPVEKFISRLRKMGVGDGHQVVIYDGTGIFSAPRVWWLFRLMGKTDVAVLDGGFPKWKAEGREVEDLPPMVRDRHMTVQRQNYLVKDVTQVASASKLGDHEIIDARSPGRFAGTEPEPRAHFGPGAGHELHQSHRAGVAGNRAPVQHRAPAALGAHDALDPFYRHAETRRGCLDIGPPVNDRLRVSRCRRQQRQGGDGDPQPSHSSRTSPMTSPRDVGPK